MESKPRISKGGKEAVLEHEEGIKTARSLYNREFCGKTRKKKRKKKKKTNKKKKEKKNKKKSRCPPAVISGGSLEDCLLL